MTRQRARSARALQWWAASLIVFLLGGCGGVRSVSEQGRANAFEAAVTTYTKLIRWGYFEEAANYVRSKDGSEIKLDLDRVARYRVTSYNNASQLTADNDREGRVLALIEYYEIDSGVVQQLRDEQYWWHDAETKRWYLNSGLPPFGKRSDP